MMPKWTMLLIWLACCPLCFIFAGQRNRPRGMWAGLGLLLGPLALLILLMLPASAPQTRQVMHRH